ncbi:MAG: ROK family protein [Bacteroidales bacterium]|nr:ROK family protein [Bacteroidales bacterium]
MNGRRILLDVGGTFIKCGDGRSVPIDSDGTREVISASLREAVGPWADGDLVGVAIPGPFDYGKGIFLMKHKFAAVYGENFRDLAGLPESADVRFIHDVNCMLLGELSTGAAKGFRNVALVTLGTGLGFSMAIDGEILKAPTGSPLVSVYSRPFQDGILEDFASKRGIMRLYNLFGGTPAGSVKEIADKAAQGYIPALGAFREAGEILALSLRDILSEYGIECLLFGGQISKSFRFMEEAFGSLSGPVKKIAPVSDFDRATFNGLEVFLTA